MQNEKFNLQYIYPSYENHFVQKICIITPISCGAHRLLASVLVYVRVLTNEWKIIYFNLRCHRTPTCDVSVAAATNRRCRYELYGRLIDTGRNRHRRSEIREFKKKLIVKSQKLIDFLNVCWKLEPEKCVHIFTSLVYMCGYVEYI